MQQILEKVEPQSPSSPSQLPSPAKSSNDLHDKISKELVKGRDSANKLRCLLNARSPQDDLIQTSSTMIDSFSNCLLLLCSASTTSIEDMKKFKNTTTSPGSKFEDSRKTSENPAGKDRRGCYKRRKTTCQSWTVDYPTQTADSHGWRKYGQKGIRNTNYPRNYYRCTHKLDQGCLATKQVQQIAEDPPLFRTTYIGYHTCTSLHKTPQIILDSTDHKSESPIPFISFESYNPTPDHELIDPFFSSFSNMPQHENHQHRAPGSKEAHENMMTMNHSSSSTDYLSPSDPTTIESSGPILGSDHGNVDVISGMYSCTNSSYHSLGIDTYSYKMMGSVDDFNQIHEIFQSEYN